jgi:hypothetical protein
MKKVLQPFKAPRNTKQTSSPKFQASPTTQSPRRQGKSDKEGGFTLHEDKKNSDSEGPTELVLKGWVVKETQEADIMDRCAMGPSNGVPSTTTDIASPDISEFEAYLERALLPGQPEPVVSTTAERKRKRISKNDEYWEGILQREKERQLKDSEGSLTTVEAMMVGVQNEEDNEQTTKSLAKEKALPLAEPNGGSSGAHS